MAELYNFSKNLTAVINSTMKKHGFKKKATKYLRESNDCTDIVYFQRHPYNLQGLPFEFYLNIGIENGPGKLWAFGRLSRPTTIKFPSHYAPFWTSKMTSDERNSLMSSFTDEERDQINKYNESRKWIYDSEGDLNEIFVEAEGLLNQIIPKFYSVIHTKTSTGLERIQLDKICREYAIQLYNETIQEQCRPIVKRENINDQ